MISKANQMKRFAFAKEYINKPISFCEIVIWFNKSNQKNRKNLFYPSSGHDGIFQ